MRHLQIRDAFGGKTEFWPLYSMICLIFAQQEWAGTHWVAKLQNTVLSFDICLPNFTFIHQLWEKEAEDLCSGYFLVMKSLSMSIIITLNLRLLISFGFNEGRGPEGVCLPIHYSITICSQIPCLFLSHLENNYKNLASYRDLQLKISEYWFDFAYHILLPREWSKKRGSTFAYALNMFCLKGFPVTGSSSLCHFVSSSTILSHKRQY